MSNAQLSSLLEGAGFEEVGAFRTSGNAVLRAGSEGQARLSERLEQALADGLGFEVSVFLRTADELRAIAQPFDPERVERSAGKLQVALLPARPRKRERDAVLAMATDEDPLAFGERELYWLPSGGLLDSPLDLDAIEHLVGPTTRRTMGTIEGLVKKFFAG